MYWVKAFRNLKYNQDSGFVFRLKRNAVRLKRGFLIQNTVRRKNLSKQSQAERSSHPACSIFKTDNFQFTALLASIAWRSSQSGRARNRAREQKRLLVSRGEREIARASVAFARAHDFSLSPTDWNAKLRWLQHYLLDFKKIFIDWWLYYITSLLLIKVGSPTPLVWWKLSLARWLFIFPSET